VKSTQTRFPRWNNLSPTMKGIASFGLCFLALVLVSWILRSWFAAESEAVAILSLDRPDDAAALATPFTVGTMLIIEAKGHDLPGEWMRCEGQTLRTEDYPDLAAVLGAATDASSGGQLHLPDYRGLSVARISAKGGILRWFGTGTRRIHSNLTTKGVAALIPVPGMTMSELSLIIRVR
jgi:Phage Tail Collar Domain